MKSNNCTQCGVNLATRPNGLCEMCVLGQDPYAASASQPFAPTATGYGNGPQQPAPPTPASNGYRAQQPSYTPTTAKSHRKTLVNSGSQNPVGVGQYVAPTPSGNGVSVPSGVATSGVQVYTPGGAPVANQYTGTQGGQNQPVQAAPQAGMPLTKGITKNLATDQEEIAPFFRWIRSITSGTPLPLDKDVTSFQVFPDYTGQGLNSQGNSCDQVIVYGKINTGIISENNDVEVYGHRDRNNYIIASRITNCASGTTVSPTRCIPLVGVWILTILLVLVFAGLIYAFGLHGLLMVLAICLCFTNMPLALKIVSVCTAFVFGIINFFLRMLRRW